MADFCSHHLKFETIFVRPGLEKTRLGGKKEKEKKPED